MNAEKGKGEDFRDAEGSSDMKNLKKEIIKAVKTSGHGLENVSDLVRKNVSSALKGKVLEPVEIKQVVKDIMGGILGVAEELGLGLAATSRKIAKGIIKGSVEGGGDTTLAAGYAMKYAIKEASGFKADIGQVAIATSDGVMEALQETGGNPETTARALIAGAIESASAIGKKNGRKIRVDEYLRDYIDRNHRVIQG
ncbi:MAG TPA: hypothetical protein VFG19_07135 [Geobacteraceae bacterium]|nr:hypothetical protein [Geobacteraceae bacterium]